MFGRKLMDYVGDIGQFGGIKKYVYASGRAKGVEAYDVDNGSGLDFTVLADRGLDIGRLRFRGMPVSFLSKTGVVSPYLFSGREYEWLRSFTGGFLTTCGFTQVGDPCRYEGREHGLHGLASNLPAEDVCASADWQDDRYVMRISGKVRQAAVLSEHLVLRRTLETAMGEDRLSVRDTVTNEGNETSPFMILYHINFGYPLLNPQTDVVLPTLSVLPWDDASAQQADRCLAVGEPARGVPELTYDHDMRADSRGRTRFLVADSRSAPEIAVVVEYDKPVLDNLTQWKYLRPGEYVMALEPSNNHVRGVAEEAARGTLKHLEPGQSVSIELDVRFLHGAEAIALARTRVLHPDD